MWSLDNEISREKFRSDFTYIPPQYLSFDVLTKQYIQQIDIPVTCLGILISRNISINSFIVISREENNENWIGKISRQLVLDWTHLQKLFTKKSIKEIVKKFVQSGRGLELWNSLKNSLVGEFSAKVSRARFLEKISKASESVFVWILFKHKIVVNKVWR